MVRTTTRRRTKRDVTAAAHIVSGYDATIGREPDRDRADRLVEHGWAVHADDRDYPISLSENGRRIGAVASGLIEREEFEWVVDIFGVGDFVDTVTSAPTVEDAVDLFAVVLSAANLCDEARHRADTQDVEFDHSGLFAPHISAVDARRGSISLIFADVSTADAFVDLWSNDIRSSVAVQSASKPTRVTIGLDL